MKKITLSVELTEEELDRWIKIETYYHENTNEEMFGELVFEHGRRVKFLKEVQKKLVARRHLLTARRHLL